MDKLWIIDDVPNKNDDEIVTDLVETHDQQQQQHQPQKIVSRRRSERIQLKRVVNYNDNENKNTRSESNGPPMKKTKTNQSTAKKTVQPASSPASVLTVDDIIEIKTKKELSNSIYGLFSDFRQDEKFPNRFNAKCTVCDEDEDGRVSFYKGINSNLKRHLERVSKLCLCFRFCSMCFLVYVVQVELKH